MKKYLLVALLMAAFSVGAMAQREPSPKKCAISAGVLQGGGGLVGVDFEAMIGSHFSAQAGVGLLSFGVGVNYHFKPFINSSMISLLYWHQGIGNTYTQALLGPVYTFRAPKVFQFQIGLGAKVGEGPNIPEANKNVPVMLLYSIGIYFPI
jgi:predicted Kef-type K+ transport protein